MLRLQSMTVDQEIAAIVNRYNAKDFISYVYPKDVAVPKANHVDKASCYSAKLDDRGDAGISAVCEEDAEFWAIEYKCSPVGSDRTHYQPSFWLADFDTKESAYAACREINMLLLKWERKVPMPQWAHVESTKKFNILTCPICGENHFNADAYMCGKGYMYPCVENKDVDNYTLVPCITQEGEQLHPYAVGLQDKIGDILTLNDSPTDTLITHGGIPRNTGFRYVPTLVLDAFVNYTDIKSIHVLNRYGLNSPADARSTYTDSSEYHKLITQLDKSATLHVGCHDDIFVMGETATDFWWFWYDCDVSDCSIGRCDKVFSSFAEFEASYLCFLAETYPDWQHTADGEAKFFKIQPKRWVTK